MYRFKYKTEEEKNRILENNKDKYFIEYQYFRDGNYIVFSDNPLSPPNEKLLSEKNSDKISILEAENKKLQEGLKNVLAGDMRSLAEILYPEDFENIVR